MQAGAKLWYVPGFRYGGEPREVVVTKVGRKWAYIDGRERIDIETLVVDGRGFTSPGRCYQSREEWEAEKALREAWDKLVMRFRNTWGAPPDNLTVEKIAQINELLGWKP